MNFKFDIDDLLKLSVKEVKNIIDSGYKCPLKELKLFDLLLNEKGDTAMRHGVYMFFNEDNQCIYVGKCSSSHFAHRLGGHFGMSPLYGMNTFLKGMVKELHSKDKDKYESYVQTVKEIGDCSYLMINANGKGKKFIGELEKLFQIMYRPKLNVRMPAKNKTLQDKAVFESLLRN